MLKFALQYESVAQFVKEFPEKIATTGVYVKSDKPVEVGDAIMGEGHMLQGSGIGAMQIEVAEKPKTLDDAKSDAARALTQTS